MTSSPHADLDSALDELGRWVKQKKKPTRHHARAVLIAMGRWIEDDTPAETDIEALGQRIETLVAPLGEAWEAAVHDELILACTEHVQSVDPRYLDHPRYDFAYTLAARETLEARLVAATALDMSPSEELLNKVSRADQVLQPYLDRRGGESS